jgi:type III pantothenate kinase
MNSSKRTVDYLLIDVSNSFTKIAASTVTKIAKPIRLPTPKLTKAYLKQVIRHHDAKTLIVSSVVPSKIAVIRGAAQRRDVLVVNDRVNLGVGVDYPRPATIGADRLANAAAVAELYGCPAIVVDFGTAVTFDVISAERDYVGGVITPGLEVMTTYLYQRTALLPKISLSEPRAAVGKSTRTAMLSGAVLGYRGLIREIIERIRHERFPRQRVHIVATGGYADLVAARLPLIQEVNQTLTLEGLRIIANLNCR